MTTRIAFSVDDICPKQQYGLFLEFGPMKYLKKIHDEFGTKFTAFVIPRRENKDDFDIIKNTNWTKQLSELPYIEIAVHGFTHTAIKPEHGRQEFIGLTLQEINQRVSTAKQLFEHLNIPIKGFKSPGWAQPKQIYSFLKENGYTYIADHFIGYKRIFQNGIYRIPYSLTINELESEYAKIYAGETIIIHSHINNDGGKTKNAWDEKTYQQTRNFLLELQKYDDIEFIFMKEMVK